MLFLICLFRSFIFHRDICIDNVYVDEKTKDGQVVVYSDARLMVTKVAKRVFDKETAHESVSIAFSGFFS